ncbi:MAG: serine kinase [bacterium]
MSKEAFTSVPSPVEFSGAMQQAWRQAALAAGDGVDRDYRIGGCVIRLRHAGPALIPALSSALAHLEQSPVEVTPDLTIHLWDTQSSGISLPYVSIWNDCTERGAVRAFAGSGLSATRLQAAGVCSLWDPERQLAFYWARSANDVPGYERGAPLRGLLHAWWRERHGLLLHAAAVGAGGAGALLVGRGGVGKSTSALACLAAGMQYVSDDYCLLKHYPDPMLHSLYSTAKLHASDLQLFPALRPLVANPGELGEEKALCFLHPQASLQIASQLRLTAILLPRVTGKRDTRLVPASGMDALCALAPSALMQLPDAGAAELTHLRQVVTRVPCYWLEAGTELPQIPAQVREAIGHA